MFATVIPVISFPKQQFWSWRHSSVVISLDLIDIIIIIIIGIRAQNI
jgi:hypothetical protein